MSLGGPKKEQKKFPRTDRDELLAGMGTVENAETLNDKPIKTPL